MKNTERDLDKEENKTDFSEKAFPKEGMAAFYQNFISKANFKIPKDQKELKFTIKLEIGIDGGFNKLELVPNNQKEILDEVIRVFKELPKWNPAKENGEAVISSFYIPVIIRK